MKPIITFFCLCLATFSFGQIVNIPDANFKNALLNHDPVIDTNGDEEIQVSEAEAFTGFMDVSAVGIADMTGIEAFINMSGLDCSNNPSITVLDVSNNTELINLNCLGCNLSNLDVTQNTKLEKLDLFANFNLVSLDVSQNLLLTKLNCAVTLLNNIDLSNNSNLTFLWLAGSINITNLDLSQNSVLDTLSVQGLSNLSEIDVTQNTNLMYLRCDSASLSELDISNNPVLSLLNANHNQLSQLNTSQNPSLAFLAVSNNQLLGLDLSQNTQLNVLGVGDNMLTTLNIANGNNENLALYALNNPDLNCIEVDSDIIGNIPEHWEYDSGVEFSKDCFLSINENVPAITRIYPNPTSDVVYFNFEDFTAEATYRVYSLGGRLLLEGRGTQISLQNIPTGVYFVVIKMGDSLRTHRVIKK